jgi:hypothetical protein
MAFSYRMRASKCQCGTEYFLDGDRHSCDECGWSGCIQHCVKPCQQKPIGSRVTQYFCIWCKPEDEVESKKTKHDKFARLDKKEKIPSTDRDKRTINALNLETLVRVHKVGDRIQQRDQEACSNAIQRAAASFPRIHPEVWKCRCGIACALDGDRQSCHDCGWSGCKQHCVKPNLQKSSGSGDTHYSCISCKSEDDVETREMINQNIEASTISKEATSLRCVRCNVMKPIRGSLYCEGFYFAESNCAVTSCGCDRDMWFVCPFQIMLSNFRLRGLCPVCLQRLKDADSILSVQEREARDTRERRLNQERHHHLQYLRYYVDQRDSFRNVMVQDYLKSLEQESDFV